MIKQKNYSGNLGLITIDFDINIVFKQFYNILEIKIPKINKSIYKEKINNGFGEYNDGRELNKINQWEKLSIY